jgi:ribosomal protein S15P/S13E
LPEILLSLVLPFPVSKSPDDLCPCCLHDGGVLVSNQQLLGDKGQIRLVFWPAFSQPHDHEAKGSWWRNNVFVNIHALAVRPSMASRRESMLSVRSAKPRKYSTDRHQRQARLSLAIEEGRSLRPPLAKEDEVSKSFLKDVFSNPQSTTFTQADTFPCPLEVHPGKRVRGFSDAVEDATELESLEFRNPFVEPTEAQQLDIEQRGAIIRRANTDIDAEEVQLRIMRTASDARGRANRPLDRLRRWAGIHSTIRPGAFNGLELTAGFATSHATAILSQNPALVYKRKAMYVLEYDLGEDSSNPGWGHLVGKHANHTTTDDQVVLFCGPPKRCETVVKLRKYLEDEGKPTSLLRLVYVCNNEEAINYLSGAFGISGSSAQTEERSFRDWMQDDRDLRRASHKAIRWRPAFDLARGVICAAFGLDFGSLVLAPEKPRAQNQSQSQSHGGNASLYRQRIAVYMQRAFSAALPGPRVTRFNSGSRQLHAMAKRDTVIICEYSSGEAGEIVSGNVLLGLNPEPAAAGRLASPTSVPTLQAVLSHVFDGLYQLWRDQIALIHEPHALLEDHIYAHPSDSSRARDVWAMSQRLHTMLKLVNRHSKVIEDVQDDFTVFSEGEHDNDEANGTVAGRTKWLTPVLDDFEVLADNLVTDYLQPLEHMIDLVCIVSCLSLASVLAGVY